MDIKTTLEEEHSKSQTIKIVNFIGDDKARFKILVNLFLNGEYRITQRAAMPVGYVAIAHPFLIKPYIGKFVEKLEDTEQHPAIPRNILRIFEEIEIPEKYAARVLDLCYKFMADPKQPIAVRAFSITVVVNISRKYPELINELKIMLQELASIPQQSPAVKSRIKQAFKLLNK